MGIGRADVALIVGYGLHGRAVRAALDRRSIPSIVVDDRPGPASVTAARDAGVDLIEAPSPGTLAEVVSQATIVVPTPGLRDAHPVFDLARRADRPIRSEFDLAAEWDDRPLLAITGTNGKTTVTTMVTEMLLLDGTATVAAGNTDIALVSAIDDAAPEVFVVEASSFRLGHTAHFKPMVAAWLNFDEDHLDVHASLAAYEAAKARIWTDQGATDVAIGNADDEVVMRNFTGAARKVTFGIDSGDDRVVGDELVVGGEALVRLAELSRRLPHDVSNALAAAAVAVAAGVSRGAVAATLRSFDGLAHRVELIGEADGIRWFDDSKATTPHAVVAGLGGFDSAVLIAGGRNKGVNLAPLASLAPRLRAVVAIGEAAGEVADVFAEAVPVTVADSMKDAVRAASRLARAGDAVVLSPACTSYDWYADYSARGTDFARLVRSIVLGEPS